MISATSSAYLAACVIGSRQVMRRRRRPCRHQSRSRSSDGSSRRSRSRSWASSSRPRPRPPPRPPSPPHRYSDQTGALAVRLFVFLTDVSSGRFQEAETAARAGDLLHPDAHAVPRAPPRRRCGKGTDLLSISIYLSLSLFVSPFCLSFLLPSCQQENADFGINSPAFKEVVSPLVLTTAAFRTLSLPVLHAQEAQDDGVCEQAQPRTGGDDRACSLPLCGAAPLLTTSSLPPYRSGHADVARRRKSTVRVRGSSAVLRTGACHSRNFSDRNHKTETSCCT